MSFDPSIPSARDRLRLQLGDTSGDPVTEFLLDETYDATLAYYGNNEVNALISLAEALIAKFSQSASRINLGDMEFSWRDRMTGWQGILDKFEGVTAGSAGGGFVVQKPVRLPEECLWGEYHRHPWFDEPWWTC